MLFMMQNNSLLAYSLNEVTFNNKESASSYSNIPGAGEERYTALHDSLMTTTSFLSWMVVRLL